MRERDAMTQERVAIAQVPDYLATRLKGCLTASSPNRTFDAQNGDFASARAEGGP